jgi:DNA primase
MLSQGKSGAYDKFRHRIMFPIHDRRGRIIAFGGRALGEEGPKYLNSPETELFHKGRELYGLYQARKSQPQLERILVVEGYMDVVALAQFGFHNCVATLGTATTGEHAELLFRAADEVLYCFDGDRAGRQAAWRALEATLPRLRDGRQARFLFLPEGEDPDSMVRRRGAEAFAEFTDSLQPGDYWVTVTATHNGANVGLPAMSRFIVDERDLELDNPAADPDLMAEIADITGAAAVTAEQLGTFLDELLKEGIAMEITRQSQVNLWDNWPALVLFVLLMATEWVLRKRRGLV